MPRIQRVGARQIFNSRGEPTLEVEVWVDGVRGVVAAPSGASVGKHEAPAIPQGGVKKALEVVRKLERKLWGVDPSNHVELTKILKEFDGTDYLTRIGASCAYGLTVAAAEACAISTGLPLYKFLASSSDLSLPIPLGNIVGGGKHALSPKMDLQELMAIPVGARTIRDAVQALIMVHRNMGVLLAKKDPNFTGGRGDEGAWTSSLDDVHLLGLLQKAVEDVESEIGFGLRMGVDLASSTLWDRKNKLYRYRRNGVARDEQEQLDFVLELMQDFELLYVEDPFHEESFQAFSKLTSAMKRRLVCGDDLVTTSLERLERAVEERACNAVIMKVNQVGFLSDALAFAEKARSEGLPVVASHRSGENPDEVLAHLAIAARSKLIKTGVIGGERISKLNELIRIEEDGLKLASVNHDE